MTDGQVVFIFQQAVLLASKLGGKCERAGNIFRVEFPQEESFTTDSIDRAYGYLIGYEAAKTQTVLKFGAAK